MILNEQAVNPVYFRLLLSEWAVVVGMDLLSVTILEDNFVCLGGLGDCISQSIRSSVQVSP